MARVSYRISVEIIEYTKGFKGLLKVAREFGVLKVFFLDFASIFQ